MLALAGITCDRNPYKVLKSASSFQKAVLDWTYGIAIVLQFHMTQPTREHNLSFLMTDGFEDCHYNAVDGLLSHCFPPDG